MHFFSFKKVPAFEWCYFFLSMLTAATSSVLSAKFYNSELRTGCPNLGHACLCMFSSDAWKLFILIFTVWNKITRSYFNQPIRSCISFGIWQSIKPNGYFWRTGQNQDRQFSSIVSTLWTNFYFTRFAVSQCWFFT